MKYLTMEDIEKFKQDGFLVKKKFFDENEISERTRNGILRN